MTSMVQMWCGAVQILAARPRRRSLMPIEKKTESCRTFLI